MRKAFSVLITPLDWGLGHATRCVPVISEFLRRDCKVSIATTGGALQLLKKEFPQLTFFELVSYNAEYTSNDRLLGKLFLQSLKFMGAIRREHQQLKKILTTNRFDLIISDNRFGCYSKNIRSIFITHQVNFVFRPSMKWAEPIINFWNRQKIKKFDHCWIPDLPNQKFTGELSAPKGLPVSFIGILSRFQKSQIRVEKKYDLLALISGPEPQRTIFEKIIREQCSKLIKTILLVKGNPDEAETISTDRNLAEVGHLKSFELQEAINASEFVICRSGYSTVMDLAAMEKNRIIFVPTPGQPEQEYLAKRIMAMNWAYSVDQDKLNVSKAIEDSMSYKGLNIDDFTTDVLVKVIENELRV